MSTSLQELQIELPEGERISALAQYPNGAKAAYVLAHGAGAGMRHAFMAAAADALAERGIATLRFQFPYMERGSKRPDTPALAQATVRAAVVRAGELFAGVPLFAGGKSFGGRMTSQAQAREPLPGVKGLVFVGFPLHPADQPSSTRAEHLARVILPMLFIQGTRDKLAHWPLVQALVRDLGERATLLEVDNADHAFHVPARSGRTDAQVLAAMMADAAAWMLR